MRQKGFAVPLIILGAVVLIVAAAGAFYLGKIVNSPIDIVPVITSTLTPTPSVTPGMNPVSTISGETANWKTYHNSKLGIEFIYPPDYAIEEFGDVDVNLLFHHSNRGGTFNERIRFLRKIIISKPDISICGEKEDIIRDGGSNHCYKEITIGGVKGIKYIGGSMDNIIVVEKPELQIIIDGDIIYRLLYGETVDKILSSFKFLN